MKAKFWTWALVGIIALLITNRVSIFKFFQDMNSKSNEKLKNVTLYVDVEDTTILNSFNSTKRYDGVKFTLLDSFQRNENPDVIIRTHSNEPSDEYNIYSEKLYSPFVMISEYNRIKEGTLTEVNMNSGSYCAFEKNLKNILDVLDRNGTLSEMGLYVKNEKDDTPLKVYIPDEGSPYYDEVVKFLYIGYYNTPMTEENRQERYTFINSILNKCIKVENIIEFAKTEINDGIVIMPEYALIKNYNDILGSQKNTFFYGQRTNYVGYDILVRKDLGGTEDNRLEEQVIGAFESSPQLYKLSYLRVQNRTFSENDKAPCSRILDRLNIVSEDNFFPEDFEVNKVYNSVNRIIATNIGDEEVEEETEEEEKVEEVEEEKVEEEVEPTDNQNTEESEKKTENNVKNTEETNEVVENTEEVEETEEETEEENSDLNVNTAEENLEGEQSDGMSLPALVFLVALACMLLVAVITLITF